MCVLTLLAFTLLPTAPLCSRAVTRNAHMPVVMGRKPGVSEPEQIKEFVAKAGANLIVVDARNTDFSVEPGDEATNAKAPIGASSRARAVNAPFDRKANALDVSLIPQEWIDAAGGKEAVPVITHCGGGGRGQKAKDYLESQACRLHTPARLVGEEIHPRRATHTHRDEPHTTPPLEEHPNLLRPTLSVALRWAAQGFKNVVNGGGPEDAENWEIFGSL